ncbi:carboxylate--amine ligase [Marinobacterium nitratireducens]|uniref:Carboxylate--amine ligase n=1 Tax=Marinobacterium nitratireducens TaxID=518897 RepID=A0A917ZLF3_9GAMM|nr:siderophore biosynthesis protein [Marinobacterium nitratireducens]GGO84103.1 carboxylate--amine ligase [Marinobacterium nitratireducens]
MPGQIVFIAHVVTEVLNEGFLPAARALGLDPVIVTDLAAEHRRHFAEEDLQAYPDLILSCDVFNPLAVIETLQEAGIAPAAVFSHSDHLQTTTALVAQYFGLPGKDWQVCYRAKNKAAMRAYLAAAGAEPFWYRLVTAQDQLDAALADCPWPCVVKPREGVASLDVSLVRSAQELRDCCSRLWARQPGQPLLIEEYLEGPLCTLETLGDGERFEVLGGFRVELSEPPHFIEQAAHWGLELDERELQQMAGTLRDFGIGFGSCHSEFVLTERGPRLIEINYRTIGDGREFLLAETLGLPLFERVLQLHLGESLPALDLSDTRLLIHYVLATESGRLEQVPGPRRERWGQGFVDFQPLRRAGDRLELSHSNKDYLGVIRAAGDSLAELQERTAQLLAGLSWEVRA